MPEPTASRALRTTTHQRTVPQRICRRIGSDRGTPPRDRFGCEPSTGNFSAMAAASPALRNGSTTRWNGVYSKAGPRAAAPSRRMTIDHRGRRRRYIRPQPRRSEQRQRQMPRRYSSWSASTSNRTSASQFTRLLRFRRTVVSASMTSCRPADVSRLLAAHSRCQKSESR